MAGLTLHESVFVAICLEGILYGFYAATFATYLYFQASTNKRTTILFYALCTLFLISTVMLAVDIGGYIIGTRGTDDSLLYSFVVTSSVISGVCNTTALLILTYRSWIVWNRNIFVAIIPSILALAFLALWIPGSVLLYAPVPVWVYPVNIASFALTFTVNAMVTGLIAFGITKIYRDVVKSTHATGGNGLRLVIFIFVESGMALLCFQLAQLVLNVVSTDAALIVNQPIAYIVQILNGITPTFILARVSLGLSFDDQESLLEAIKSIAGVVPSTRFESDSESPTPNPDTASYMCQEGREDDNYVKAGNK